MASDDKKRDLAADLALCEAVEASGRLVDYQTLFPWIDQTRPGWPAAIRRALAAEAILLRLAEAYEGQDRDGVFEAAKEAAKYMEDITDDRQ